LFMVRGKLVKQYFEDLASSSARIRSEGDMRLHVVSSVRLILQQALFGLLEWASVQPIKEGVFLRADLLADVLHASDGTLVDALEDVSIYCEQLGWQGVSRALFTPISDGAPCRNICGTSDATTSSLLRGLVRLRNDGAEGHGLPGDYDKHAERDCLRTLVEHLAVLLPNIENGGVLVVGPDDRKVRLKFLRLFDRRPALIRSIKRIDRSRLRIDVQYKDKRGRRQQARFEAENFLSFLNSTALPAYSTWPNSWNALCYLPERTTEAFQGRADEQQLLSVWMDDEDSRTCLVYGDGGVGKTTLVVEYLHRFLDEDPDLTVGWRPKVVSFYTAKKWRWGINGVELIASGNPNLLGLIGHLHLLLLGRPASPEFYRLDAAQAAVRLQQMIAEEAGIKRDDHLIVVDNSETLISSGKDVEALGKELREISRRLGRVIVTSRRREVFEATPVLVDKLKPLEAVNLLKRRAKTLGLRAIERADGAQLLGVVNELGARPIVMEAFVQALTSSSSATIEKAKARVSGMLRRDLGEFLFADAWNRYEPSMKRLLLLMARVADVHDARQLAICCEISGVALPAAEEALEESSGIASIVRLSSGLEVAFSQNFLEFIREKTVTVDGKTYPIEEEVSRARRKYGQFVQAVRTFTGDRIAPAFRTAIAKAAHRARQEGRLEEALRLYQQAVLSDSSNGWLFDRFAWFLFHDMRDPKAGLVEAKRATELLPSEGEVWFTRGMVESRLGDYRQCEASLERAEACGVDKTRTATQRAWAYLKSSPALLNLARKEVAFTQQALGNVPHSDRRWIELGRVSARLAYLEEHGRDVVGRTRDV
jgi:tetratricopeptide (TPR) repeat protein